MTFNYAHGWAFPLADAFMIHEIKEDGGYQRSHLDAAMQYVTDWSLALDCGAHCGTWSRLLASRFERVIAVEPSADTFEALTANMQTFGCSNVELRNVAVGEKAGTVTMVLDGRGALMKNTGARRVQANGPVPLVTIDSWALSSLGFLKLDVEGYECHVLNGARETLRRCHPVVLHEDKQLWRQYGVPSDGPKVLLTSLGYRQVEKVGCDVIWVPR